MANSTPPEDDLSASWNGREISEKRSSIANSRLTQSWPGPRTVSLQRCERGFGFTLRHFIVYPPSEISKNHTDSDASDLEVGREPMDTIFVKHVKEGSPAQRAGLNTGDRIVSVNGETTAGKSYSQVVQLIQRSGNMLQLLVVPKEDDILQLYFPGTAYRSSPDSHNLPEGGQQPYSNSCSSSSAASTSMATVAAARMDLSAQSHPLSANDKRTFVGSGSCSSSNSSGSSPCNTSNNSSGGVQGAGPDLGRRRYSELPSLYRAEVATIMPERGTASMSSHPAGSTWSVASMGLGLGLQIGNGGGSERHTRSIYDLSGTSTCTTVAGTTSTVTVNASGMRTAFTTSASGGSCDGHTKLWTNAPGRGTANNNNHHHHFYHHHHQQQQIPLPPSFMPCPPAPEYVAGGGGNADCLRKMPLGHIQKYDGQYGSVDSMRLQKSFSVSQDSLSLPPGTPPPLSFSATSSREASMERPDATDPIINRLKASFEKKEEFLLRSTPSKPDSPAPHLTATSFVPSSPFPATDAAVKEYYPHPQRFSNPQWPPTTSDLANGPDSFLKMSGTRTPSSSSSPPSPTHATGPQTRFPYDAAALCPAGTSDELANSRSASKPFVSSLTRIQENIPTSEPPNGADHQPSLIRPLENGGQPFNPSTSCFTKVPPLLGGRLLKNAPLRKACSLDSELLPSSRSQAADASHGGGGSGGSAGSVDSGSLDGGGRMQTLHLVSQRARQFELGALEQETNNRMNLYKNELARLTTRGSTPKVSDRAAQFESLSTSQETLGSESDYCPSPRQKANLDLRKDNGHAARMRSCATDNASTKNSVSMASAVAASAMIISMSAAAPNMNASSKQAHRNTATGSHPGISSSSSGTSLSGVVLRRKAIYAEEDDDENRAVRRVSYLRATSGECLQSGTTVDTVTEHHREVDEDNERIHQELQQRHQHYDNNKNGRSQSIQKLKAFFGEKTPQIVEAAERRPLHEYPSETCLSPTAADAPKEGWLHCKVAAFDGKRATDRSWKQMWAVPKGTSLYLYRDKKDVANQILATVDEQPIDLKCCQVDVANDYTKKKHVFRLVTSSGSEYLLQADSHSDMQRWINYIQGNLNINGKSGITQGIVMRKSAMFERELGHLSPQPGLKGIRKLTTFRNRSPTGHSPTNKARKSSQGDDTSPKSKTWRGKMVKTIRKIHGTSPTSSSQPDGVTIGVSLDECPPSNANEFVPFLVELCTSIVEARGLEVIGIYRVPGNTAAVSFLLDAVNHGFDSVNFQDPKWNDVNVISSLLKAFFRKLPEPLVTGELYPLFIEASKVENAKQRMCDLKRMLHELPDHNYETLKYLIRHLQMIVAHSCVNKMEARNLAIVFGPTLVRAADDNMVTMVTDMSYQCRIVEMLITHADWFFSMDENEDISNQNFPLNGREILESSGKPLSNQNLLLNNLQKMEHVQSEGKMKDVSAKDLVSSVIVAANRKVRQKMKKHMHSSHHEPSIEERDIDREIELRLRHPRPPDVGTELGSRGGGGGVPMERKVNGVVKAERRHSEDSSTSSLSTRTTSEECCSTSPRKMSVDSLDSLQGSGSLKMLGGSADKERMFCVVRHGSSKRSTWNGTLPERDFSADRDFSALLLQQVKGKEGPPVTGGTAEKLGDDHVLKTYAGLSASMQERIRQFELETKALLQRDLHRQKKDTEQRELDRQRIEMEWQRAKKDLEQDDFLDQLADNPSVAKKISDITQKIQSLQNSHLGQWDSSKETIEKLVPGPAKPPSSSGTQSKARLPPPKTDSRDWATVTALPSRRPCPAASQSAMKRVSSVDNFVAGSCDGAATNGEARPPGRAWGRTSGRRKVAAGEQARCRSGASVSKSSSSMQPAAKWCGSLDSLREFYETTSQDEGNVFTGKSGTLHSGSHESSSRECWASRHPRVPPYQPPPAAPMKPARLQRFGSNDQEQDVEHGSEEDVHVQRNENTLITATLSPTKHTISSTSTTAVITATIVARSSKAAAGAVATIARNALRDGTDRAATNTVASTTKPAMSSSEEKKGESQKRASSQSMAVLENGFKKGRASPPPTLRKSSHLRNLKRRHTVGGTKDFEKFRLLVGNQFDKQDPVPATSRPTSSAWERLRPAVPPEERSMKSWLRRERLRTSSPDLHGHVVVGQPVEPLPSKGYDSMDVDVTAAIARHEKRPSSATSKSPPALESQV